MCVTVLIRFYSSLGKAYTFTTFWIHAVTFTCGYMFVTTIKFATKQLEMTLMYFTNRFWCFTVKLLQSWLWQNVYRKNHFSTRIAASVHTSHRKIVGIGKKCSSLFLWRQDDVNNFPACQYPSHADDKQSRVGCCYFCFWDVYFSISMQTSPDLP